MMHALLAFVAHAQDSAAFGAWTVACDNTRACAAFGLDDPDGVAFLRVTRGAGADDMPGLLVGVYTDVGAGGHTALLTARGAKSPTTLTVQLDTSSTGAASGAEAARFVAALANATDVEVRVGADAAVVSLSGSSAALRWMDDRQKRAGGVTALVAKGSAIGVPAPPAAPVVKRAAPAAQEGLPIVLPAGITGSAAYHACGEDPAAGPIPPERVRLAPGVLLWGVTCWAGAYNTGTRYWLADEAGTNVRLAKIPGSEDDTLVNATFDVSSSTLGAFSKVRGLGDCGVEEAWVWDGATFQLARRARMDTCAAVPPEYWPTVYRADVR